jgi:hypothetical protein
LKRLLWELFMLLTSTNRVKSNSLSAKLDIFQFNFPITLASNGSVVDVAGEMGIINTTKDKLSTVRLITTFISIGKVERENRLLNEVSVDHVVERRDNALNADAIESQSENTVKFAESKSETWFFSRFSEILVFDADVSNCQYVLFCIKSVNILDIHNVA